MASQKRHEELCREHATFVRYHEQHVNALPAGASRDAHELAVYAHDVARSLHSTSAFTRAHERADHDLIDQAERQARNATRKAEAA